MAIIDGWISVADRPPDMGRTVMIGSATHNWVGIGHRVLVGEYLHWEDGDGEDLQEPTHWMQLPSPPTNGPTCEDMAFGYEDELRAEIERLREAIRRLAEQDATLSVVGGNVTVTMDATLTDAERDAVAVAARFMDTWGGVPNTIASATLRGLLERTKPAK